MKSLVLTEQQLNNLKEYYLLENYIGSVNESIDLNRLWQKYKQAIVAGVAITTILASINNLPINRNAKYRLTDLVQNEINNNENNESEISLEQDNNFQKKVEAVKDYIIKAVKNQGYNPDNLQLSPEEMVRACEETGYDLPMLMAQAHLESCFGFGKRARETNSVFSVGCYDNGKNMAKYSSQNASIMPYIKLMQNDYLRDNKSVDDILTPNAFVNMNGHRYAQDKNYENKVKSIRNKILKQYPELA